MKKVVILHPAHWEQAMGGAELQISYLVEYLTTEGFELHYIYEDKGTSIKNENNVFLHPLKKINIGKTLGQIWFLYKKEIFRILIKIKPDVIYTRFYSSWSGFAARYAYEINIKHVWAIASDNDLTRSNKPISLLKPFDKVEKKFVKHAFKNATHILTQNQLQQKLLLETYDRKGIRINQLAKECKEHLLVKDEDFIQIVWVANLKKLKRPNIFIELASFFEHVRNVRFIMIGRSNSKFEQLITNAKQLTNFDYLGELSNTEVNKILQKSHILVNTSIYEGFSNTFVQSWMHKVIVLSMNSNPDGIFSNEKIGFICPTIEELKIKIEILVKDMKLRNIMAIEAYNYSIQNHSINNIKKVISLMEK